MQQLNGIDVSFLNMETPTTFGHVSSLNIYDPTTAPGGAGVEATKRDHPRAHRPARPFRRRLVEVPLGLDLPYWIDDPGFDIDFHVRHHAVAPPGTPEQLAETVSRIVARPLDRSRPLWELYVIEGLEGGYIAQLTKVHHATIDGASGAVMLAALLDTDPSARASGQVAAWTPEAVPTDMRAAPDHVRGVPAPAREGHATEPAHDQGAGGRERQRRPAGPWPTSSPSPSRVRSASCCAQRLRRDYGSEVDNPPALPPTPAPRTPFNRPITGAPPLRVHHDRARGREEGPPRAWLHLQRRRDGPVLGHAPPVPLEARRAATTSRSSRWCR